MLFLSFLSVSIAACLVGVLSIWVVLQSEVIFITCGEGISGDGGLGGCWGAASLVADLEKQSFLKHATVRNGRCDCV